MRRIPLPAPLQLQPTAPFVGRGGELGKLLALWSAAGGARWQVALVGGEAGSGKTRLAREFGVRAAEDGARVLYGACDAVVRAPYGPFIEALERCVEGIEPATLEAAAGPRAAELIRLLPGLRRLLPDLGKPAAGDPDAERHRLHTAVVDLLAGLARQQPMLLILDDLHWADGSSLELLRHLSRTGGGAGVVVLATFREGDGEATEGLADALAELHRLGGVVRMSLGGLDRTAIEELLRPSAGREAVEMARVLARVTDGNPFLVEELCRHVEDQGGYAAGAGARALEVAAVPPSVRDVIEHRLSRLEPTTRELLEMTALSGRGLEIGALRAAVGMGDAALVGALEEAVRSGILQEIPGVRIGYRFRHELLRRAVHDRMTSARRATLHVSLAEALEEAEGGDRDRVVGELAFHFGAAAWVAGSARAVKYALAAAVVAERKLAFGEAAGHLRVALELGLPEDVGDAETYCRLGMALHLAGEPLDALECFARAAALACDAGDAGLLARAAIGFETACWRPGSDDPRAVELLQEAVRAVPEGDGPERVRLLAHLSRALAYRGDHAGAGERWTEAVALARSLADPNALAVALAHAAWTRGSQPLGDVLAAMIEARQLAEAVGDRDLTTLARGMGISLLLESGAIDEARHALALHRAAAERAGEPFLVHVAEYTTAAIALCEGRLEAAESAAVRAYEVGRQLQGGPSAIHGIQMFSIRREQGRLAELAPLVRTVSAARRDRADLWTPALAVLLAEVGELDAARAEIARLSGRGFEELSGRGLQLGALIYLADACALVDDAELAAPLYDKLRIFEGQNTVIGVAVACYGAVDRQLGALAASMGDSALAERHFGAALELNGRLGSPTWLAHTHYERARMLIRRGRPEDRSAAEAALAEALALARRVGMTALIERIERLRAGHPSAPVPDHLSPREVEVLRLVAAGLSNRRVAEALFVSEHTVANHLRSILAKTGSANRTQAAAYALRHGLARE